METAYGLIVLTFLIVWWSRSTNSKHPKNAQLSKLTVSKGRIIEQVFDKPNGKKLIIKGKWKY